MEDVGILGKEAEDQPGHEMVHVRPPLGARPVGIVLQQLDIKLVQAARRPDVEGALADLLDGGDARQWQEYAEVIGKLGVGTGNCLAAGKVFRLELVAIGGEDEFGLCCEGLRAVAQGFQGVVDGADAAGGNMDVAALKQAAGNVRRIGSTGAQFLDRRRLVSEGFQKRERKLRPVKRLGSQIRNGLFDLYCIHGTTLGLVRGQSQGGRMIGGFAANKCRASVERPPPR